MDQLSRRQLLSTGAGVAALALASPAFAFERRNEVSFLRGPYNMAFYHRHNLAYRIGAGMHFFHSKQHDLLQRTPLAQHEEVDATFARQALGYLLKPLCRAVTKQAIGTPAMC